LNIPPISKKGDIFQPDAKNFSSRTVSKYQNIGQSTLFLGCYFLPYSKDGQEVKNIETIDVSSQFNSILKCNLLFKVNKLYHHAQSLLNLILTTININIESIYKAFQPKIYYISILIITY
jgi:hypothetical protein